LGDERRLYIGLMQIEEENQFYVYDWRAPISSMFYDFGLGAASYEAPFGKDQRHDYPPQTVQDRGWRDDEVLRYGSDVWLTIICRRCCPIRLPRR
jgi:hypothetical protein